MSNPFDADLSKHGFHTGIDTYQDPPIDGSPVSVKVDPNSKRLQLLERFKNWDRQDFKYLITLIKVWVYLKKCDHKKMAYTVHSTS